MKQVTITYLGHACFCLEFEGYRTVLDPYDNGKVPGLADLCVEAEAVYCSHDHADHNAVQCVHLTNRGTAPYTVTELVTPHDHAGGKKRGMNTVRMFDFGGLRVAHMGDVGRPLTAEETAVLSGVDCLLIPVGGFFTISAGEAKEMADAVKAKVIVPMHYRTKGAGYPLLATVETFTDLCTNVCRTGSSFVLDEKTPAQVLVMTNNN